LGPDSLPPGVVFFLFLSLSDELFSPPGTLGLASPFLEVGHGAPQEGPIVRRLSSGVSERFPQQMLAPPAWE